MCSNLESTPSDSAAHPFPVSRLIAQNYAWLAHTGSDVGSVGILRSIPGYSVIHCSPADQRQFAAKSAQKWRKTDENRTMNQC
jgi:hypothetical protein